jgi:predicted amidohydrolase YtcJ
MEEVLGSIEQGKQADLVILDRDPFKTDRYAVPEIQPTAVLRG